MSEIIELSLPVDDEGYVSFACPHCNQRFKLSAAEVNERDPEEICCPLCGLSDGADQFHTPEALEAAHQHVENMIADLLNDFTRNLERSFRGSKNIQFKQGKRVSKQQVNELRETPDFVVAEFSCCASTAKVPVSAAISLVYCPFCGQVRN